MNLNETASIISPKRSPLFMEAVYRNILCYVFQHNYIPNKDNALLWDPDIKKTNIVIELEDNDTLEVRQKRPAIIIGSTGVSINDQISIGHSRAAIDLSEGLNAHYALSQIGLVLFVDSCNREESKALAYCVAAIICTAHQSIRKEYGIHHIDPLYIGNTTELNIGEGYYRTPITFNILMDFVWDRGRLGFPVEKIDFAVEAK